MSFLRRNAIMGSEEEGHRLVSAANRGGEGLYTTGTQEKTTVVEFGKDFPTAVVSCTLFL